MTSEILVWVGFNLFILFMLALDLGVIRRRAQEVSIREATVWSLVWFSLAMLFNVIIYYWKGPGLALEFFTGYLIEKSLSVDNIFVILMIFGYFCVPSAYQHKVLFWGILGALVMRAVFIAVGAALITKFHWMIYLFGGFLVLTGIKMGVQRDCEIHPEANPVLKLARRLLPVTSGYAGDNFFVRESGRLMATPLLMVVLLVESTDVIFAADSIPAIFAVTRDPFIVYTSNVFAILGLRSLFFLLARVMNLFCYLKIGLAAILTFVGLKMLLTEVYKIHIGVSLGVVFGILAISVLASMIWPAGENA